MHTPLTPPLDFSSGAHGDPEVWLPRLLRLIEDQLTLTRQIDGIDERKARALHENDMDAYLAHLEERQPVIDSLTSLNDALKPFADRFAILAASLKEEQRNTVFAQAGKLDAALHQITLRDTDEAALIATRREQIARELGGLRNGRNALGAYGSPNEPLPPQCLDDHH